MILGRPESKRESSRFEALKEIQCGWSMKCKGILVRDEAGEVCGGQVIQHLFSWLRHLYFILKTEGSYRRIFSEGYDIHKHTN